MSGSQMSARIIAVIIGLGVLPIIAAALSPDVKNLGPVINSKGSDFAPVVSPDGNYLFFTSDRGGGQGNQDIWVSERTNGEWTEPVNLGTPINNELNQGPDCFFSDAGKEYIFITYCHVTEEGLCDIYVSEKKEDGAWSQPKNLGAPINTEYSDANASWDYINQALYFVSTRPGGIPGEGPKRRPGEASYDVWMAKLLDDGKWGQPVNLGPPVNTPGWEGVAFYHAADQSLYFSSDGHGGQGGADIFKTRQTAPGVWSEPEPVESVNTPQNDIYFSIPATGDVAYFSTSVAGGEGAEDIYMAPVDLILSPEILAARTMKMPPTRRAAAPGAGHVETIYFDFDKAEIRPSEAAKLDKIADFMNQNLGAQIEIAGHADSVGDEEYNLKLSQARAESVFNYLRRHKINPDRLTMAYFGETRPAEPNDPVKGNPLNRRADLSIK